MKRSIDVGSRAAPKLAPKPAPPNDAGGDLVNTAEMLVEMHEATLRARSYAEGWVEQRKKMTQAVADFESSQMSAVQILKSPAGTSGSLPTQRAATKAD